MPIDTSNFTVRRVTTTSVIFYQTITLANLSTEKALYIDRGTDATRVKNRLTLLLNNESDPDIIKWLNTRTEEMQRIIDSAQTSIDLLDAQKAEWASLPVEPI